MSFENLLRDAFEFLIVFAVGATLVAAVTRIRRGQIHIARCEACDRSISRAYATCPKCGAAQHA